jgi:hypothetical protein
MTILSLLFFIGFTGITIFIFNWDTWAFLGGWVIKGLVEIIIMVCFLNKKSKLN